MKKLNLLSKAEMKKVMGGDAPAQGCCAHDAGWAHSQCGYDSAADAESVASQLAQSTGDHWYWCCQSCP